MKRKRLPLQRAVGTTPKTNSLPKLRLSTLAFAAAVTFGLAFSTEALALAMGRVTVQSALGEPLRADIDLPEINAEEIASLRAAVASPAAFRAAGLEYSPTLANVQITLQRRPTGGYFLRLSSDRTVTDPFVDVILEATWSSGRVQRDFTMLFDPPSLRAPAPAVAAQSQSQSVPAQSSPRSATTPSPAPAPRTTAPATASAPARAPAPARAAAPAPAAGQGAGKQVTVHSGDTAGKLAGANKPASVSLDQMLVAMLRANPEAFVDGNINRLKSGAVLDMPSADAAGSVPPEEARQTLVVQSRDFNEFRRRLAEGVPSTGAPGANRQASGRVQGTVEDRKPSAAAPDKLTLSKGAVQGSKAGTDQIARERATRDAASRVAELNKNITDLNRLTGSAPAVAGNGTGTGARAAAGITAPP
ncbi:MAG: hypothetical protein JWP22_3779, partial [Ramlibacter sp.]|nr:hypothetical protein [Ramlibacter sp.]